MIQVKHLTKQYTSGICQRHVTKALDDVDLTVPKGTIYGLTGESGCGKSTLAHLLMRFLTPTSGTIRIDGRDLGSLKSSELRALRPSYQIIWQNPDASLNPRMKMRDNILDPVRYHKRCDNIQGKALLEECCAMAELSKALLDRYPHEVSGGENQRVVIARMLTLKPKLLIADEPTSSLDILVQAQILDLLKRVQEQLGMTMLFISHDLQAIHYMCEQVAVMRAGRIVESGLCRQVFTSPATPYCRELIDNAFPPWRFAS